MTNPRNYRENIILMEEGYWKNCQYSIASLYGRINTKNGQYLIVNKEGITLLELSNPYSEHYVGDGRKAIEPGEPADLVMFTFIPTYKKVGRDAFIKALKAGCTTQSEIEEYSEKLGSQLASNENEKLEKED